MVSYVLPKFSRIDFCIFIRNFYTRSTWFPFLVFPLFLPLSLSVTPSSGNWIEQQTAQRMLEHKQLSANVIVVFISIPYIVFCFSFFQ